MIKSLYDNKIDAEYVEYGTRYQSAQPYFEPAVDENEDKFNDALDEIIERLLE